jgi:adenylate kinase
MRLVFLGAPGAGKGTQAQIISEKYNIPHISTGDIFRDNIKKRTKLGNKAKEYIDKGLLVPDKIAISIVEDRLRGEDCKKGFILDGFPRTIPQALALDEFLLNLGISLDFVINILISDEEVIKRLSGRRVCFGCGRGYHVKYNPPKIKGVCDICGVRIVQREDDEEETIIKRLKEYHRETEPLINYYTEKRILRTIESQELIEDTTKEMIKILGVI